VLVAPKPPKPVPVLEAVLPPPNMGEGVAALPKPPAGLLALPNRPLPVLLPNAEGVVVLVFEPNPPKPVPVLGVLEPPKRPPEVVLVVGVEPKAGLLPKPLVVDPKAPTVSLAL
jgi:hypothetical protein